jgi:SAM-dependent methyltransferase
LNARHLIRVIRDIAFPRALLTRDFICPICHHEGFLTTARGGVVRRFARCPYCGSLERHRLAVLAMQEIAADYDFAAMDALHFAPEPFLRDLLRVRFRSYQTADLYRADVDHRVDIRRMPFPDDSFDFVLASHVLEHVDDDESALREITRALRPNGIAILPVPLAAEATVEYPHAVETEHGHVRAPGMDYYERFSRHFRDVRIRTSADFAMCYQAWNWEDRTRYPTPDSPYRPRMTGERHLDAVPICIT